MEQGRGMLRRRGGWNDKEERKSLTKNWRGRRKGTLSHRLYAIVQGKVGVLSSGLYEEPWDRIEILVSRFSKRSFKIVKTKSEEMAFIWEYFLSKRGNNQDG